MTRPILFVCSGGCLLLGTLLIFAGAGVIIFTQVNIYAVSLITAAVVFLGLAGLFFSLMIQEKKEGKMKGRSYFLLALFSLIFSFLTGILWMNFIVHPPTAGNIISPLFYKNYWWTIFLSSAIGIILAGYFWQKAIRKGGVNV